jgi:hypothetical protein
MMEAIGVTINCAVLIGLVLGTWFLPRSFGIVGLVGAQLIAVAGWIGMGGIALFTGIWPNYEGLEGIGLVLQAFVFNCLLLPIGVWAILLFRRDNLPTAEDKNDN